MLFLVCFQSITKTKLFLSSLLCYSIFTLHIKKQTYKRTYRRRQIDIIASRQRH